MSQKLEDRLHLYERDHPIRDDQELISALEAILEEQDELPVENRDFDLISEATDAILHLNGYSDEQLSDMADKSVERIFSRLSASNSKCRKKTHLIHSKIAWIIIAIIVLTITSTAISASVLGINIPLMTKKFILSLTEKITYRENDVEAIRTNDVVTLSSIYDLQDQYSDYNLTLPLTMSDSINKSQIIVEDFGEILIFEISLDYSNSQNAQIRIIHDHSSTGKSTINLTSETEITFSSYDGIYQAEFYDNTNNNHYLVQTSSSDFTRQIISNMEEKNESHP